MIRAFPYGFNYPIPRGWPIANEAAAPPYADRWEDMTEAEKERWHGFRMITRVLAKAESFHLSELVIDVNQLPTGLNCTIFNTPCDEYINIATLLTKPGFRRLDLPLLIGGQEHQEWPAFRNGYFHGALSSAADLEHFSLCTILEIHPGFNLGSTVPGGGGSMAHFIPLQTIFPISDWPKPRHFHLSRFIVTQSDLINLLVALSPTIQTVSLNFLSFLDNRGNYHSLLLEIRDTLKWHERDIASRPKLVIGIEPDNPRIGLGIWVEREIHAFLYEGGENPFTAQFPNHVLHGTGLERDSFEDEHERPHVKPSALARMGIHKPNPYMYVFK